MSRNNCVTEFRSIKSYQPARNAIDSAKRWIEKADENSDNELNPAIDKFFSLYVSYNILYSLISKQSNGDRYKAVTVMSTYIVDNEINTFNKCHDDILKMIKPVSEDGIFYIYDKNRDRRLIDNISDSINFEESVLDILYGIRCNMFHGEKELINEQLILLKPANKILRTLIEDLINSITTTSDWTH